MQISISIVALATALAGAPQPKTMTFPDTCDASAAVALGDHRFVVGDDESNVLRIYDLEHPENVVQQIDISKLVEDGKKEIDIEGAAQLGDRIFWITSHGRNDDGEIKKRRQQLLATVISRTGEEYSAELVGRPYPGLIEALLEYERVAGLGLRAAAKPDIEVSKDLAPKTHGLNIEGLSPSLDGQSLLIGLRNPVADGGAIVIPLLNPNEVVEGKAPARFGAPAFLDLRLDGKQLGIRSIDVVRNSSGDAYEIVGGPIGPEDRFALFRWSGDLKAKPKLVRKIADLRPEALFAERGDKGSLVLLSDDGEVLMTSTESGCEEKFANGKCPCKHLKDTKLRKFRALAIAP